MGWGGGYFKVAHLELGETMEVSFREVFLTTYMSEKVLILRCAWLSFRLFFPSTHIAHLRTQEISNELGNFTDFMFTHSHTPTHTHVSARVTFLDEKAHEIENSLTLVRCKGKRFSAKLCCCCFRSLIEIYGRA